SDAQLVFSGSDILDGERSVGCDLAATEAEGGALAGPHELLIDVDRFAAQRLTERSRRGPFDRARAPGNHREVDPRDFLSKADLDLLGVADRGRPTEVGRTETDLFLLVGLVRPGLASGRHHVIVARLQSEQAVLARVVRPHLAADRYHSLPAAEIPEL